MSEISANPAPQTEPETETNSRNSDESPADPVLDAIIECLDAYDEAWNASEKKQGGPTKAWGRACRENAVSAYRRSLPPLSSRPNILAFMGCVAEGVLREIIPANTGSGLIYAAQAAMAALPREAKRPKRTKKRTPPPPRGSKKDNRPEPELTTSGKAA